MLSWACILCGYELHAQAVSLVQAQRTRPSMASNAQSLCHPRFRVHAPADPGQPGLGLLSAIPEAISHHRSPGPLQTEGSDGSLGRSGLLRSSSKPPPARARGYTSARRHAARRSGVPQNTARCREVHSGRGGVLCVREARCDSRYQCSPSSGKGVWIEGCVDVGGADCAKAWRTGVALQSSPHGIGGARLYGAKAQVPRVPGQE